jgi:hypothetical protein
VRWAIGAIPTDVGRRRWADEKAFRSDITRALPHRDYPGENRLLRTWLPKNEMMIMVCSRLAVLAPFVGLSEILLLTACRLAMMIILRRS